MPSSSQIVHFTAAGEICWILHKCNFTLGRHDCGIFVSDIWVIFIIVVVGVSIIAMPRTVSWGDVMFDHSEDSVVVCRPQPSNGRTSGSQVGCYCYQGGTEKSLRRRKASISSGGYRWRGRRDGRCPDPIVLIFMQFRGRGELAKLYVGVPSLPLQPNSRIRHWSLSHVSVVKDLLMILDNCSESLV